MSEGFGNSNKPGPAGGAEPTMEEILASIRRILTEEENERAAAPDSEPEDDILVLDSAAMVPSHPVDLPPPPSAGAFDQQPMMGSQMMPQDTPLPQTGGGQYETPQYTPAPAAESSTNLAPLTKKETYMDDQVQSPMGLVSDQAANEIANTVGSLVRSVSSERSVQIGRPGVTIEDLVREEVKPVLKAWLDTHLPSLVERVVRAEIGRVIDRM